MKPCFRVVFVVMLMMLLFGCQGNLLSSNNTPMTTMNSDLAITDSVNTVLANDSQLAGIPIQVQATQGIVELNGYVKTIRQSDTALELASRVPGVKGVQNNLIVRK